MTQTKDDAAPAVEKKTDCVCCYIGCNVRGLIQSGTVYPAGKAEALKLPELARAVSAIPEIAILVVPSAEAAAAMKEVKKKGTALYRAEKEIEKRAKEKNEGGDWK